MTVFIYCQEISSHTDQPLSSLNENSVRQPPLKHTRQIDMCKRKLEKLLYLGHRGYGLRLRLNFFCFALLLYTPYTFVVCICARFEWVNPGLGLNCHPPNSQFVHRTYFVGVRFCFGLRTDVAIDVVVNKKY